MREMTMVTRRDWLRISATAGAALTVDPRLLGALQRQEAITRAIPSTGERIPVIGLGGANTFSAAARNEEDTVEIFPIWPGGMGVEKFVLYENTTI